MFPTCIKLDDRQKDLLRKWFIKVREKWEKDKKEELDYEDVCCSSFITFHIYATGLGDDIKAEALGHIIDLSIDDDNELVAHYDDWFNKNWGDG